MDVSTARPSTVVSASPSSFLPESASSLQSRSQFLKNAAQELSNPITTIKTALTLLNSSTLKPKQRERYLQMIGQACDRQSHLVNEVFELLELQLRPQPAVLDTVQLADLVPGVVSTYQPIAQEKNIVLTCTVSGHLPSVFATAAYLKQALVSLLSSSIHSGRQRQRIGVAAHHRSDGNVALVIHDSGGLGASALPQTFDLTKSGVGGLGLSRVQQLLTHCGASMSVSHSADGGATVTILLAIASR